MYKQLPCLISRRHDDEVVYLDFTDRQNEDIVSSSLFLSSSVIHVKRWRCHSHVPVIYYLYRHLFPIACFLVQIMSVLAAVKTSPKEKYRSSTSTRTLRSRDKPESDSADKWHEVESSSRQRHRPRAMSGFSHNTEQKAAVRDLQQPRPRVGSLRCKSPFVMLKYNIRLQVSSRVARSHRRNK